ncbi:MAG: hypothetical protein IPH06_00880 [Alphaproteobacteria bacterium]|jgi:hypothetical protein|nr:hypothetical protein [Alphaproteobacteria bacterium]QQS56624.1 MAG: hypothetical protein IPN28_10135 [Alphaproteobacteria bacterium]
MPFNSFKKVASGTLGFLFAVVVGAVSVVPGCREAMKDNQPGETDGEQFVRGASRGVVNAFQAGFEGATSAITPQNVEKVLENADRAGRNIQEGVDQYQRNRGGGSSSAPSDIIGVPKPDYVPGVIPGDPAPPGK